jgi:hypothetical protein
MSILPSFEMYFCDSVFEIGIEFCGKANGWLSLDGHEHRSENSGLYDHKLKQLVCD